MKLDEHVWRALFRQYTPDRLAEMLTMPLEEVEAAYARMTLRRAHNEAARQLRSSWGARMRATGVVR